MYIYWVSLHFLALIKSRANPIAKVLNPEVPLKHAQAFQVDVQGICFQDLHCLFIARVP